MMTIFPLSISIRNCSAFVAATALCSSFLAPSTHADQPLPGGFYSLTGVEITPIERTVANGKTNDHKSDTLTHSVRFDIKTKFTKLNGSESKPFQIINAMDASKSSLTVDKPIQFKGKEVPAGTNLLDYKKFDGSFFNVSMPNLTPLAISSVRIRDDFSFPADTYTLTFHWETKNGETISETVTVRIDIGGKKGATAQKKGE